MGVPTAVALGVASAEQSSTKEDEPHLLTAPFLPTKLWEALADKVHQWVCQALARRALELSAHSVTEAMRTEARVVLVAVVAQEVAEASEVVAAAAPAPHQVSLAADKGELCLAGEAVQGLAARSSFTAGISLWLIARSLAAMPLEETVPQEILFQAPASAAAYLVSTSPTASTRFSTDLEPWHFGTPSWQGTPPLIKTAKLPAPRKMAQKFGD